MQVIFSRLDGHDECFRKIDDVVQLLDDVNRLLLQEFEQRLRPQLRIERFVERDRAAGALEIACKLVVHQRDQFVLRLQLEKTFPQDFCRRVFHNRKISKSILLSAAAHFIRTDLIYLCSMNEQIEAVIFDLGGVIINLDYSRTGNAFKELGLTDFDTAYSQLQQTELFDRFETGHVSSFHFINRLLDQLPQGNNGNRVVHAWNAMIGDFPKERLEWLSEIGKKYRTFLLSNTNTLHMEAVRRSLEKTTGHQQLESYFEKVYLSCEMGLRKPDPAIFLRVCEEQGLKPETTLFIDDSPQHVEGARVAGLQAIHLEPGMEVVHVFANY